MSTNIRKIFVSSLQAVAVTISMMTITIPAAAETKLLGTSNNVLLPEDQVDFELIRGRFVLGP